ncbi:helix-turn-helix domain-containing protein [Erwiniaceae bacterium BAC15a-03b]|uniref:Helix-turn-helix domain-containing protein n=1 Tax=Winslowiella arboricola TaxID=2978220 RepID=A0A9J6PPJ2_9GAMM|nr:helix-turn-helix domain-containing protein [Winslowiella arboricola]MCU5771778.1 helix-turn-helix domain-containing protein [Winslowiella arboricola]MCU5776628.1 helix-turn-helix domain-containing protein [Winslowiella arboricola]
MLNHSICDAFRCLDLLAASREPVGIRDMGRRLNLDSAKVTRIMQSLLSLDMVHRNEKRKYSVGIGVHRISALSIHHSAFYTAVIDTLEEIGKHDISIVIGVLKDRHVVYLIHTRKGVSVARAIGNYHTVAAIDSVIGLKLLAHKSDEEIIALIGIHDFNLIAEDLALARKNQVFVKSFQDDEYRMACMIPGMQAAIALSNFTGSVKDLDKLKTFLLCAAQKIGGV